MNTEVRVEKLDNFLLSYMGNWTDGHCFAHHHRIHNMYGDFLNFEQPLTLMLISLST